MAVETKTVGARTGAKPRAKGTAPLPLPPRVERTLDRGLKPAVWVGGLLPAGLLAYDAWATGLGADPIEALTHRTGYAALVLLLVTLAVTPVRRLTGWNGVVRARRPLGLFAFWYALSHFAVYLVDQGIVFDPVGSLPYVGEDVAERPFVTVGFAALLLLVPLAVTSTKGWIRRLGKRWQKLHRLVYLSAGLGVLHFFWGVKQDVREPLVFAAVLAALLAFRVAWARRGTRGTAA